MGLFKSGLKVGDKAPDFELPSHIGGKVRLKSFRGGKNVLLAFYPLDWTPVCTNEIASFERDLKQLESLNTQPLAISVDSIPCHQAWQKSLGGISYPLLSDFWPHGKVCREYGILTDSGYSERAIFIIDKEGAIRYIENVGINNSPDNKKILMFLKEMKGD
jgi:peroxiredoxin